MQVRINKPETLFIKFNGELPKKFELREGNNSIYFERFLDGKTPRIKFNIPNVGTYYTTNNIEIITLKPQI